MYRYIVHLRSEQKKITLHAAMRAAPARMRAPAAGAHTIMAYDLQAKLADLDRKGFAVLEGLIPPAKIAALHDAFLGLLDPIRNRDRAETACFCVPAGAMAGQVFAVPSTARSGMKHTPAGTDMPAAGQRPGTTPVYVPEGARPGDLLDLPLTPREYGADIRDGIGGLAETERYTMHLPWGVPFADPAIYEHPAVLALLELYWGSGDFSCTCMSSNTPYPGSVFQRWHRDGGGEGARGGRSPGLGLKFPLCATSEENGSFQIIPGTSNLLDYQEEGCGARGTGRDQDDAYNNLLLAPGGPAALRKQVPGAGLPVRLNLRAGDAYLADPRALHRGTPNNSQAPRPEIVICFARPPRHEGEVLGPAQRLGNFQEGGVSREAYAALKLSPRGDRLLRHGRPRM